MTEGLKDCLQALFRRPVTACLPRAFFLLLDDPVADSTCGGISVGCSYLFTGRRRPRRGARGTAAWFLAGAFTYDLVMAHGPPQFAVWMSALLLVGLAVGGLAVATATAQDNLERLALGNALAPCPLPLRPPRRCPPAWKTCGMLCPQGRTGEASKKALRPPAIALRRAAGLLTRTPPSTPTPSARIGAEGARRGSRPEPAGRPPGGAPCGRWQGRQR